MIDADQDVGESGGEVEQIIEELNARVDAGDEAVALEEFVAGTPSRIDEIAAAAEISDTADVGILHVPFQHRLGVRVGEVAFGDDALGIAGRVGEGLQPLGFVHGIGSAERRLDVDRLRHIGEANLRQIIVDPVVLRLQRVDIAEKAMDRVALQPGIAKLWPLHVVKMKMRIDERYLGHPSVVSRGGEGIAAAVETLPICATSADVGRNEALTPFRCIHA